MPYNRSSRLPPPIYPNPSWLDCMKDSENDYDFIQSIDKEYISGGWIVFNRKKHSFFLEPTFPFSLCLRRKKFKPGYLSSKEKRV